MNLANNNHPSTYWPTASELDNLPGPSNRGPFQETYFERLMRARENQQKFTKQQQTQQTQPQQSPIPPIQINMNGPAASQSAGSHPWGSVWSSDSKAPTPVSDTPTPVSSSSGITSGRFNQLLKAKLAAEQQTSSNSIPSLPTVSHRAPAAVSDALSKLQSADTVFNRSFASQHYAQSVEDVKPEIPNQSEIPVYGYPSRDQMPPYGPIYPPHDTKKQPEGLPVQVYPPFNNPSAMSSEHLTANFRTMIAERITTMYASTQQSQYISKDPSYLGQPQPQPQPYWQGSSAPVSPIMQDPNGLELTPYSTTSNLAPSPTAQMPHSPSTPAYKFGGAWSDTRSRKLSHPSQAAAIPVAYEQPPFMWNVTPPQNNIQDQPIRGTATPSLHSASDSMDSASIGPITPQISPYSQLATPLDIKPIISPALSTVTLPDEHVPYTRYGVNGFMSASPQMGDQPRFIGASADNQTNGNPNGGGNLYGSSGSQGGGGSGGFGTSNTLNDLGFGSGGSGSGGDEQNPHGDGNGNGDGSGGGENSGTPGKSKKLPLACHFCRRRKLKCDGVKPSCENCVKRGVDCTYDDNVRRRGPGKRTKEMRERAAREAQAAGLVNDNSIALGNHGTEDLQVHPDLQQQLQHADLHGVHGDLHQGLPSHADLSAHDFHLDPALAGEDGNNPEDVMDAMSALKEAGMDLGIHDTTSLEGEPHTLAEVSGLGEALKDENERKRKAGEGGITLEDAIKRQRLELNGAGVGSGHGQENEIPAGQHGGLYKSE